VVLTRLNTHTNKTANLISRRLPPFFTTLCLCVSAAAQSAKEFEPNAARLRGALAAAVGQNFEVARDRLARRSNRHGSGAYWLAHLRARRPGEYYVRYRYRYKDQAHPEDPLYTFVERKTPVRVGERGCPRRPHDNFVCVGDTVILPAVSNASRSDTSPTAAAASPRAARTGRRSRRR